MKIDLSTLVRNTLILFVGAQLIACAPAIKQEQSKLVFPPPPNPARFIFEQSIYNTGAVVSSKTEEEQEGPSLKSVLTGVSDSGVQGESLAKPFDVAVHQGMVYVSDSVNRTVYALDFVEEKYSTIGASGGDGQLNMPLGVSTDANGNVYVVDSTLKCAKVYDRKGNYIITLGNATLLDRPAGIDVTPDGRLAFIVDVGGIQSTRHNILVFDVATGELVRTIGKRGNLDGEFNLPRDVAIGPDGLIYVTDGGNFRVQVLTPEGEFVRKWGVPGSYPGNFSRPKGIAIDADGNVYVADAAFGNYQIFNSDGQLLLAVGDRSINDDRAKYMLTSGIDIDEDGRVYFVGQYFRKVDVFRPAALKETDGYLGQAKLKKQQKSLEKK